MDDDQDQYDSAMREYEARARAEKDADLPLDTTAEDHDNEDAGEPARKG